jgi:hypothetical protein
MKTSASSAAVIALTVGITVASATPGLAKGRDVVKRGSCSQAAVWKVKAGSDDGRIEVEGEVDSNRNGQTWRWRIRHNGHVSAHGVRTTRAPSGSFEVRRLVVNRPGVDTIGWRAFNRRTGEVCRGNLRF